MALPTARAKSLFLATIVSVAAWGATASAQDARMVAGTLNCTGKGAVGLVLGSKESLTCSYTPASGGASSYYDGTITRVGLDLGVRGKSVMVWTVLGSLSDLRDEALAGNYAGVSADAAAGLGVGANILLGGSDKSIVLQPVSVRAETGINIAVGVSGLNLVPVAR